MWTTKGVGGPCLSFIGPYHPPQLFGCSTYRWNKCAAPDFLKFKNPYLFCLQNLGYFHPLPYWLFTIPSSQIYNSLIILRPIQSPFFQGKKNLLSSTSMCYNLSHFSPFIYILIRMLDLVARYRSNMLLSSLFLTLEIVSSGLKNFLDSCFLREAEDEEICMVRNEPIVGDTEFIQSLLESVESYHCLPQPLESLLVLPKLRIFNGCLKVNF